MRAIWRRIAGLFGRGRAARELDEEIAGHRDFLRQQLEDEGHPPRDAARIAATRFGGAVQVRERSEDEWRFATVEGFARDARLAARALARRPGFAGAAIATLALGIGTSTAIFSVAYGVSFRPLPYADPDRLVRIYEIHPADGGAAQEVASPTFHEWRVGAPSIESAALFTRPHSEPLAGAVDQAPLRIIGVSPAFFDVLGVRPIIGTTFPPESTYDQFTTTDIILSAGAWRRLFGDRKSVDGVTIQFDKFRKSAFRVLGVMPDGFAFGEPVDAWTPEVVVMPLPRIMRGWRYDHVVARLKPGASVAQAAREVAMVSDRLGREFPKTNAGWTATVQPLREAVAGSFGRATGLLLAAVAVVLIVACFNVGGLLMARAVARDRETAIRVALGAGSRHLLRLWFAESTILGISGATLGLLVAYLGVTALKAAAPPGIPRLDAIALDGPALAVALTALLVAIGVCTTVLARRSSTRQSIDRWRSGPAEVGDDKRRRRLRVTLLVSQCAGAATLVVLAVMLTRSFANLLSSNLGWRPAQILSMTVAPPMPGLRRPWFRLVQWSDDLIAALEKTPGIRSAAITTQIPLSTSIYTDTLGSGRGKATDDGRRWPVIPHHVSDGYFELMGMRLVEGRGFGPADRYTETQMTADEADGGATGYVGIVTQSVAAALWPGESALGKSVWLPDTEDLPIEIVGVVADLQFRSVGEEAALHVFLPWTESSTGNARLVVRTSGDANAIVPAVRAVLQSVSPGTRVDQIVTLDDLFARTTAQPRFTSRIVALFGAAALLLAAVGIYGTQWYIVGVRTRELGLRLALGASRGGIISSVLWGGLTPALAGGVIGLAIAAGLGRVFRSLFFGMATVDVASLIGGAVVLALAATTAALGPAVRASRVDPIIALRSE